MKAVALTAAMLLMVMPAHAIDVAITSPGDGETVSGTIVVTGTSQDVGAGLVSVSIDSGPFQPAQGLDPWTFAWEAGGVPDGPHAITARARQCIQCTAVFDSVDVIVSNGDGDGVVGITDLLMVLGAWGPCPSPPAACPADLDGDGTVGITDFLIVLTNWS